MTAGSRQTTDARSPFFEVPPFPMGRIVAQTAAAQAANVMLAHAPLTSQDLKEFDRAH
jgi:hypothetical protein